ncbi:MAG: hypothetical protein EOP10_01360 [Proteobacteria bacterium]|nr:MAG: hypothetical protein EOP10_01360 [Pseudomonadota bacterium]
MLNFRPQILILLMVMAVSIQSCSKFGNKKNEIVLQCGLDAKDDSAYYVKILDSHGNQLSAESIGQLNVEFVHGDSTSPVTLTTKSCVKLSSGIGKLSVSSSRLQESLVENLNLSDSFIDLKLAPSPVVEGNFVCPSSGIYAHESMDNPWDINVTGNIKSLDLKVIATNENDSQSATLYHKEAGDSTYKIPQQFDTSNLVEGVYSVETQYGFNTETWRTPLNLAQKQISCALVVIHSKPTLESKGPIRRTVEPGAIIPNFETLSGNEIKHCFAPRQGRSDEAVECGQTNFCKDGKNYQSGVIRAPVTAGVYDLLVNSIGPTKIRSDSKCDFVVVSNQATQIDITWDKESWRDGFAFFDLPYVDVKAKISKVPGLVPLPDEKLECKVDVLLNSTEPLRSSRVKCRSDLCNGLSMDEYVPCDENIQFTVDKIWTMDFKQGLLRLHVRSNDGAGHSVEKIAKAWISSGNWKTTDLNSKSIDNDPRRDKDFNILIAEDGSPIVYNSSAYLFKDEKWNKILPDSDAEADPIYLMGTSSSVVWGYQSLKDKTEKIYKLENEKLKFRYHIKSYIRSRNAFSTNGIAFNSDETLTFIDLQTVHEFPGFTEPRSCFDLNFYYDKARDRPFALCRDSLWTLVSGNWKEVIGKTDSVVFESMDFADNIISLKIRRNLPSDNATRGVAQLSLDLSVLSMNFEKSRRINNFSDPHVSEMGVLLSDSEYWDMRSGQWEAITNNFKIYPVVEGASSPGFSFKDKILKKNFRDIDGIYFHRAGENLFLPDRKFGRIKSVNYKDEAQSIVISRQVNGERELVRLTSSRVIHIASAELGLSNAEKLDFEKDDGTSSKIRLISQGGKTFEFKDGFVSAKPSFYNQQLYGKFSTSDGIYSAQGQSYVDRLDRNWFFCHLEGEDISQLCMLHDGKITSFLIPANLGEMAKIILTSKEIFLSSDTGVILSKLIDNSDPLIGVEPSRLTKDLFPITGVTFSPGSEGIIILRRFNADKKPESYELNLSTNSLRKIELDFEKIDGASLTLSSTGLYYARNGEGIFQELNGSFKMMISVRQIKDVSEDSNGDILDFKIEKNSNRIWILSSSRKLYLYEHDSKF